MSIAQLSPVTDPLVAQLNILHQAIDSAASQVNAASVYHQLALAQIERAIHRLNALKLQVVTAADKADLAKESGLADTGAWVARHTRAGGASAANQVNLARGLSALPATQGELMAGGISVDHAAVIARTHRQLPPTLSAHQREAVEEKLVGFAKRLDPTLLRRRARSVLEDITSRAEAERHHDRVLRDEESHARAKTRLTLHDNADGTTTGHFTVPSLAGSILRKALQQMTAPRRNHLGAPAAQAGPISEQHDWAHRQGEAFVELLEHLPTDRLHGKVAATVVVTIQHRQLLDDLAATGLDTGDELSASEARRLACNAGILPAVLSGTSQPLDLGRTQRFFTEAQRTALATRHNSCSADGCERPYAWCELHHATPWSKGGSTDLKDAVPLCGWHHQRIHDPAYRHEKRPGGAIRFHRRT